MVKITDVELRSRAAKRGIRGGDVLISINENDINDVLDYRFYLAEEKIILKLLRGGQEFSVEIKKGVYDDIGLCFETPLMTPKQSCKNKCIFCFIDQLPSGMRDTLYFKDDDSRLSFLHGNYITLTNLKDADIARITKMHISPMNISVHTMNPRLRVEMMKNKRAGEVLSYMRMLADAGITLHAQIVLCRGINDGEELAYSMKELSRLYPRLESVSIVPAGLTDFRDGLYPLTQYTKEEARDVISQVNKFAEDFKAKHGSRLFFVGDEMYIKAGLPIPSDEYYEEYTQIENGVGMLRSLTEEFESAIRYTSDFNINGKRCVSVATGAAAYPYISELARAAEAAIPELEVKVYKIINKFFGEQITVSGLLTGKDIFEQLSGKDLGCELIIPENTLKCGEDIFLCGMTLAELEDKLKIKVRVSPSDGGGFLDALAGYEEEE